MEGKRALSRPLHDPSKKPRVEHSTYGVPMSLNLGCRIFLSHSGNDKNFVRFLYEKLCDRYHDDMEVFFDEETLPKVKAISMKNILREARRSQLAVLVLTEAFFVQTPNPMLELEAFVASKVTLLPLFFGMSVKEFKEKKRSRRWEEHWRMNFVKELGGRSVEEVIVTWRHALDLVTKFSGLEYENMATNHLKYIHKIVDKVTSIIPSTSFTKEGVCGKDHLCKMVDNMYKKCAKKYSRSTALDVVGIHGFPGLGKTTLCKCLCDFYFTKFSGKVCYISLGSQKISFSDRMQDVLSKLGMHTNNNFFNLQDIEQVKNWFKKKIFLMKDPIFFAIDNILSKREYQEEVEFYLSCTFSKGSKILITSRSESILKNLVSQHNSSISAVIEYMPALDFKAAKKILINELPDLSELEISNLEDGINKCVNMCTIHKTRYHPLMLNSLAALVKWNRSSKNMDWKGRLVKLCSEGITDKDDAWERVYDMFEMSYTLLTKEAQKVFLDLVLFYNATGCFYNMFEWIEKLYFHLRKKNIEKIILQLVDLCFVDTKEHQILDLIVDYGKYKASQGEYVVLEDGTPDLDDLLRTATTVSIFRCTGHDMVDLRNVEGMKVLHIVDNAGLQEVLLSRASIALLRSLIVWVPTGTSLLFTIDEDWPSMASMSAPSTGGCLRWVNLEGGVYFRSLRVSGRTSLMSPSNVLPNSLREVEITSARVAPDLVAILGGFQKLEVLNLSRLPGVQSIDVTTCPNLKVLHLYKMPRLELINIAGFENSNLEDVDISSCPKLLALIAIPAHSKAAFTIADLKSLKRISFCTVSSQCAGALSSRTRPGDFFVEGCLAITEIEGLSQYTGSFVVEESAIGIKRPSRACMTNMGEICGDSGLQLDARYDFSLFSARIEVLELTEYNSAGARLACATRIELADAQHAGLLISALFNAQPEDLYQLGVYCKEGVDCGCDQNVPHFGPLPSPCAPKHGPTFYYHCRQVKDLASLAQWHVLQYLDLEGCTSVEIWPDFAAMTLLNTLNLTNTSLKEWPTGVLRLSHLREFNIHDCRQLPTEELIKGAKFALQPTTLGNGTCIMASLEALTFDLKAKERDTCSVADALDAVYPEFVALFDKSHPSLGNEFEVLSHVIEIMYEVWFGEVGSEEEKLHIRTRMRSLLCSESFLAFSFRACSQDALSEAWDRRLYSMGVAGLKGIALVGSSIAWYDVPVNDDLRDNIVILLKSFTELRTPYGSFENRKYSKVSKRIENMVLKMLNYWRIMSGIWKWTWTDEELPDLRQRVGEGLCRMARVGSVAAEMGETFLHTIIHDLEADLSDESGKYRLIIQRAQNEAENWSLSSIYTDSTSDDSDSGDEATVLAHNYINTDSTMSGVDTELHL